MYRGRRLYRFVQCTSQRSEGIWIYFTIHYPKRSETSIVKRHISSTMVSVFLGSDNICWGWSVVVISFAWEPWNPIVVVLCQESTLAQTRCCLRAQRSGWTPPALSSSPWTLAMLDALSCPTTSKWDILSGWCSRLWILCNFRLNVVKHLFFFHLDCRFCMILEWVCSAFHIYLSFGCFKFVLSWKQTQFANLFRWIFWLVPCSWLVVWVGLYLYCRLEPIMY